MAGKERPSELTPAEAARARRRDRDSQAKAREGMRTGLAKQFKQVLDAQASRAGEAAASEPDQAGAEPKTRPQPVQKRPRR